VSVRIETVARKETPVGRRVIAVVLGTALVSLAAQISVPLPGTPVPMTLQPLAVLIVGGLLGAELGLASLILYLVIGAIGAPVFTPSHVLPPGLGRLFGPTGGYLLAYPVAAYVVGRIAGDASRWGRVAAGTLAGLALIHVAGLAQLFLITGSAGQAARLGTLPFLAGDLLKLLCATFVLRYGTGPVRARL
jgi:biotin transport system substrate-specific component